MTMPIRIPVTEFAPAERMPIAVIARQSASFAESNLTHELLNATLNYVLILNPQRQVVFASRNVEELIQGKEVQSVLGLRPGEILNCRHAARHPGGCGTSRYCQECGAVQAILTSLSGRKCKREARVTRLINCLPQAMDLLVYATPFEHKGEVYSLLSIADISHEKRRQVLERLFLGDADTQTRRLEDLAAQLKSTAPAKLAENAELLQTSLRRLMDDIQAQKQLASAEKDELSVRLEPIDSLPFLRDLLKTHEREPAAKDRQISLAPESTASRFQADRALVRRVMEHLLKNALEASGAGQRITVGSRETGRAVRLWVHNPGHIPKKTQLQMFNRSFSTKGDGRGLGTYTVKLLTEKYLQGKVGFSSSDRQGTTFFITLPRHTPRRTK
jgi:hypothetical protein